MKYLCDRNHIKIKKKYIKKNNNNNLVFKNSFIIFTPY